MSEFIATLVPALGHALVQFTWQGLAIGAVAAIALRMTQEARPQVRYAIACLAMLACVLLPLIGVLLHLRDEITGGSALPGAIPVRVIDDSVAIVASFDWRARVGAVLPQIVALWAAGASVFCLRILLGFAWVRRMRTIPQPPLQAHWQATLETLAERFDLQGVALRLVDTLETPVVAGWLRPVVLLPVSVALRMPARDVEALLAHELAHVRRHDALVNLLQRVVEALLFFHPVTWWLSRRVRIERELIADRLAADAIGDPHRLARALAALSELTSFTPEIPHLAHAAHGGFLMSRIQHLVRPAPRDRIPAGRIVLPLLGIAAACVGVYAQAQIGQDREHVVVTTTVPATTPALSVRAQPGAAPQNASAPKTAQVTRISSREDRDAWALVRKGEDGYSMSGSTRDMQEIDVARRSLQDDFIWFRRNGKAYVIDDPSIVSRVQAAWKDSDAMGERMAALGAQMDVHGKKMEAYGAQMEKLGAEREPSPAFETAHERLMAMAEQQQTLAGKQQLLAMKQRKAQGEEKETLDREMDAMRTRMETISKQMEAESALIEREAAELQRNVAPMEALSRQMEEAGKPMEVLGKQMGELGRQQERLVRQAEKDMQALIGEAMRQGLAKPAPGVRKQ